MIDHDAHVQAYERYYAFVDLAVQAIEDPDARVILGDLIMENGWSDERVASLVYQGGRQWHGSAIDREVTGSVDWFAANAAQITPTFARAVASVLLFKEWSTKPWRSKLKVYSNVSVRIGGVELELQEGETLSFYSVG